MKSSRRKVLVGIAAGMAAPAILHWPAGAAEFTYKCGTSLPDAHPMAIRVRQAMQKIKEESGGRLEFTLYTNSVLGGDTAMVSQAIAGALEMYTLPLDLLAPKNEACGIFGVGFAFANYDHIWEAMDGELGNYLRGLAEKIGFRVVHNCYDHGFREITTRTRPIEKPEDLKGLKIRLPVAPYLISLFQHLGASPTPINFSEVYSALQTGVVDGQENPLILIDTAKLYEVQKYCSITNHVWAGIHVSFSNSAWKRLPPDLQEMSEKHFNEAALMERDDWQTMTRQETENLKGKGMVFNAPDIAPFQEALRKSGFYPDMKSKAGDTAWALLEKYVGKLA
ncbi:MAG TPA: TRAP transporter substrate-binding protein [Stellaceae bacterium]|nr:TRAP transporter substrate-binding protein [Stellaceae bacterium]